MIPPTIIIIFLQSIILTFLLFGAYSDWKKREVSHWITNAIIIFSLPLIYWNLHSITIIYQFIVIIYVILCELNYIGGSDTRVLIAIIYSLNPIHLGIFLIVMILTSLPFVRKNPNDIPWFIPIFLAYSLNTFMFLV